MTSQAYLDATGKKIRPRDRHFLRPEVLEWLEPEGRVPYGRARALETLVAAYTKERRVLTGITLWLGAALGAVLLCVGTGMLAEGIATSEPGFTLTGVVLLLPGLPLVGLSWRYGVPLLRAGRAVTRAAVGWLGDAEESITGLEQYAVSRRVLYRGPVFFRLMLSSVTGLAVFCFGPMTGYCLVQLPGATGERPQHPRRHGRGPGTPDRALGGARRGPGPRSATAAARAGLAGGPGRLSGLGDGEARITPRARWFAGRARPAVARSGVRRGSGAPRSGS